MESVLPGGPGAAPHRGRLNRAIKESLRDLGAQLSLLNHSVGTRLDLKATDLECLDLVTRDGPLSPSTLARRAGLHPATLTGILDRLERGGGSNAAAIPPIAAASSSTRPAAAEQRSCASTWSTPA